MPLIQDPGLQQAQLLAARLGELAALTRPQVVQARQAFITTQLRRHASERRHARDKLKAHEFLAGG
jgi:hypothetical protein